MEKDYSKIAGEYFKEGHNCAQSVLLAFADELSLDKKTLLMLGASFGGGMGRLREVCGAVSAMFIITGLLKGYANPCDDEAKAKHYELIQKLAGEFKDKHNTIICRELLELEEPDSSFVPAKRTEEYYAKRPCEHFIETAAKIVADKVLYYS